MHCTSTVSLAEFTGQTGGLAAMKQSSKPRSELQSMWTTTIGPDCIAPSRYVTPEDCLKGLSEVIGEERDCKLEAARQQRQEGRAAAKKVA